MFEKMNFENNNKNMKPKTEGEKSLKEERKEQLEKVISNIVDGMINNNPDKEAVKWLLDTEKEGNRYKFRSQLKERVYFAVKDCHPLTIGKVKKESWRILEKVLYRKRK